MLSFQVYANKAADDEDRKESQMGMKARRLKEFVAAHADGESLISGDAEEMVSKLSAIEKTFRKHGLSDFISTLTPGAQNAIYAASFAWGYENAARYVKSAMKLGEVKSAQDSEEKSRAVISSMQKQASDSHEQNSEVSKFVWGFYNEDMKETQAVAGKSETLTDKEKEKQKVGEIKLPLTSADAVAAGLIQNSHNPELLYCVGAAQQVEQEQSRIIEAQKKEDLAKLVSPQRIIAKREKERAELLEKQRVDQALLEKIRAEEKAIGLAAERISEETVAIAMQRKEELVREYGRMEEQLRSAMERLDSMAEGEANRVKKIAAMLPRELERHILSREKYFARRGMLKKQLAKWLAFSKEGRGRLIGMPLGKMIRMFSLSNLFK